MSRYTFRLVNAERSYALFARANHQLAFGFAGTREKSAQNWRIIGCSECISSLNIAA